MTALRFEGNGFEYFKIWIVNILLLIVTAGLFWPWAKVRNRRYFYGNSTLDGQNFDYHATGKQLFIGYLISLVLLIAYVLTQQFSPVGSLVVIGIFFVAYPWIIWRSLQFNMRMTSFSNVRFGFDGKLGQAYINFMLLPLLFMVSVYGLPIAVAVFYSLAGFEDVTGGGLILIFIAVIGAFILAVYLYALMKKRNTKYVIDGTKYGQGQFTADLNVGPFVGILFKTIGLSILAYILVFVFFGVLSLMGSLGDQLLGTFKNGADERAMADVFDNPLVGAMVALIYIGMIIISLVVYAYSFARQRKYIFENTMLDNKIAFKSTLGARQFAWVSVSNLLLVFFTLGLAMPYAKVRMARVMLENTYVDTGLGFDGYITAQQKVQSSLGDQIGDAFDVDVGIGL